MMVEAVRTWRSPCNSLRTKLWGAYREETGLSSGNCRLEELRTRHEKGQELEVSKRVTIIAKNNGGTGSMHTCIVLMRDRRSDARDDCFSVHVYEMYVRITWQVGASSFDTMCMYLEGLKGAGRQVYHRFGCSVGWLLLAGKLLVAKVDTLQIQPSS